MIVLNINLFFCWEALFLWWDHEDCCFSQFLNHSWADLQCWVHMMVGAHLPLGWISSICCILPCLLARTELNMSSFSVSPLPPPSVKNAFYPHFPHINLSLQMEDCSPSVLRREEDYCFACTYILDFTGKGRAFQNLVNQYRRKKLIKLGLPVYIYSAHIACI